MKTDLVYDDWAGYWHGVTSSGKDLQVYEQAMKKQNHNTDPDFWEQFIGSDGVRDVTNTSSYDGAWIYAQRLEQEDTDKFMKGKYRLRALWGYETQEGRQSPFWQDPAQYLSPKGAELFQAWLATKRPFTKEEVIKGKWEKYGDETGVYFAKQELRLFPDGTLREHDLGKPQPSWDGRWHIVNDGVLRLMINDYELDVIANKIGNKHSGINFVSYHPRPLTYFTMIHIL